MSTSIITIPVTDYYKNRKQINAMSFYGGKDVGTMVSVTISHVDGNRMHMTAEMTKEQATDFANAILKRINDLEASS